LGQLGVGTICHSISMLFGYFTPAITCGPSGSSTKHCPHCGLKTQPRPLHTLVMTPFYLARSGCEDEDLFGILGCLLGLVAGGADASLMADLSLTLPLGREVPPSFCSHKEISPADLARGIAPYFPAPLPFKADVGWRLFCHIMRQCEQIKEVERM